MIGLITLRIIRYKPPTNRQIADVSPIVPAILPINISNTSTVPPLFNIASGVAVVTPSYVNVVIFPANDINRKHLAPSAGFIKF